MVGASFFGCCEATVTASRAAETSAKKRGQNTGTTLNAKLADPDQPLAATADHPVRARAPPCQALGTVLKEPQDVQYWGYGARTAEGGAS